MSIYFQQAKRILSSIELPDAAVVQAKELFTELEKTAGSGSMLADPRVSTAINLLTPFVVNYKVNQVIKLLKELSKEKNDPATGLRRFIQ